MTDRPLGHYLVEAIDQLRKVKEITLDHDQALQLQQDINQLLTQLSDALALPDLGVTRTKGAVTDLISLTSLAKKAKHDPSKIADVIQTTSKVVRVVEKVLKGTGEALL
ncbi:hypothetical protein [Photobacterium halotolerans]|uniref:Uncharacterized protein n=1 Tax=Photobacterium halotolerans TaxID=265726 RepID=A0A0F5VAP8_9GAMM|nr:hypothetical protein [Photobacterium halotolerans]KKC98856.1 hypothetical protein KY46_16140 [Photobacterium halotolerans]